MKCPFMKGTYMFSCSATRDVYVPSAFEFDEYCMSVRYTICPFFCKASPDGKLNFTGLAPAGTKPASRPGNA